MDATLFGFSTSTLQLHFYSPFLTFAHSSHLHPSNKNEQDVSFRLVDRTHVSFSLVLLLQLSLSSPSSSPLPFLRPVLRNVIPLMSTAEDIEFVTETDRTMREREEERSKEFDSVQQDLRGQWFPSFPLLPSSPSSFIRPHPPPFSFPLIS